MRETLAGVARELAAQGVASPLAEAEILLAGVFGLLDAPRAALHREPERELSTAEARTLASLILRRGTGVPVQYLVRRAWFRDLTLEVGPGVLVPRPETEVLAGEVLAWLTERLRERSSPLVLDLGTGSGCIALAIVTEHPGARVVASDLSLDALRFARANRARAEREFPGVTERVSLVAADGLRAFRAQPIFDVIVSNPPYVGESERESLPREVRDHEPAVALFAGPSGISVIEWIVRDAPACLRPGGLLAIEVSETQADNVIARISSRGAYGPARAVKDLAGKPRVVLAERLD